MSFDDFADITIFRFRFRFRFEELGSHKKVLKMQEKKGAGGGGSRGPLGPSPKSAYVSHQ